MFRNLVLCGLSVGIGLCLFPAEVLAQSNNANATRIKLFGGFLVPNGIYTRQSMPAMPFGDARAFDFYSLNGDTGFLMMTNNGAGATTPAYVTYASPKFGSHNKPCITFWMYDSLYGGWLPIRDIPIGASSYHLCVNGTPTFIGASLQDGVIEYTWSGSMRHYTTSGDTYYPVTLTHEVKSRRYVATSDYNGVTGFSINSGLAKGDWQLVGAVRDYSNIDGALTNNAEYDLYDSASGRHLVWSPDANQWGITASPWDLQSGWVANGTFGYGIGGAIDAPNFIHWNEGVSSNYNALEESWITTTNWSSGWNTAGYVSWNTNGLPYDYSSNPSLPGGTNWPEWYLPGGISPTNLSYNSSVNTNISIFNITSSVDLSSVSGSLSRIEGLLSSTNYDLSMTNFDGISPTGGLEYTMITDITNHYSRLLASSTQEWHRSRSIVSRIWTPINPLSDARLTTISLPFKFKGRNESFSIPLDLFQTPLDIFRAFCRFFIWVGLSIFMIRIYIGE